MKMHEVVFLPTLRGPGFILRPFEQSDDRSLHESLNDEKVARKVSHIPFPYTLSHAREWIKGTKKSVLDVSKRVDFAIDVEGMVVGSVAFINLDGHKAQVSYWIAPYMWGNGFAPDALRMLLKFGFEELKLVRIYAYVYSGNRASTRVLEKCGFVFEGTHRKEWRKIIDGEEKFFDSNYYSIIDDDFNKEKTNADATVAA
jgi:RimJ/RimL family protein N-acetyltransferase